MKKALNSSVKAVLALSLVMVVLMLLAATAVLYDLRQRELAHAKSEITSLSRILAEQTTRTFEGVAIMMSGARERLSDNVGRRLELNSYPVSLLLQSRIAGLPQVKSLFVVDANGLGVNSSRSDFIQSLPLDQRSFFRYFVDGGKDEIFISAPERARVDGQWTYYMSVRLLDADGQFRGLLVASISVDYFESLYDGLGLDLGSHIQLLTRQGLLMAGKPHQEEMFAKQAVNPETLQALEKTKFGVLLSEEKTEEDLFYVAYRQISKFPLVISVAIEEDEVFAQWHRVFQQILAGVVVVFLFVVVTTFIVLRALMRKANLELALRERDEQLRSMVQSVRDAIVTVDSKKCVVLFNKAAEKIFGVEADQAIGQAVDQLFSKCLPPTENVALMNYLEGGMNSSAGLAVLGRLELRREQENFPVELSLSTSTFHGEIFLTAVFRDLTERQRAEKALMEKNKQLQALSAAMENVREEERTRIARELHDELGQFLTGIRMEISWLGGRLPSELLLLKDKVSSIKGQIDQTIKSVRRISSELRPLVLDDLGFAAAANWYVDQFNARNSVHVRLDLPDQDPEPGSDVATALFRILQESLTNIARHAQASQVDVCLKLQADGWRLSITDNGIGFDPASGQSGLGLLGMRERVHILGGVFNVTSMPNSGSSIDVVIPEGNESKGS